MKYIVEDKNEELLKLINNYPKEMLKTVLNDDLAAFQQYTRFYTPITKELVAAYIFCNYVNGGMLFFPADIADATLEVLEILDLQESISFIEKLYIHYENGMRIILHDTTRILVGLYIGTMTVTDVIKEENEKSTRDFEQLINKYLEYLQDDLSFDNLYYMMMYDYMIFVSESEKQTNIQSYEDGIRKVKALYCANHIYSKK